jgi:hypothetical protein
MEPILTIKGIKFQSNGYIDAQQKVVQEYLQESLRTAGAAYDHIGFSWVHIDSDDTYTVYGYGWWNGD